MNRKITAAIIALPVGVISSLTQSVAAAEIYFPPAVSRVDVAQRYDNNRGYAPRAGERQEQYRRYDSRRDAHRRVWIPGHWESGFLGIGRKWVEGRWENR
jgi:hypothetical protein